MYWIINMNKILKFDIESHNTYMNVLCYFTFDSLLEHNVHCRFKQVADILLSVECFKLEDYKKWIAFRDTEDLFDDKYFHFNNGKVDWELPKEYEEFLDTQQHLYTYNDTKCVDKVNSLDCVGFNIEDQDVFKFEECIESNPITNGSIEYLKHLENIVCEDELDELVWLNNLTDTFKTLLLWVY